MAKMETQVKKEALEEVSTLVEESTAQKMQEMTGISGIWPERAKSMKNNARNEREKKVLQADVFRPTLPHMGM